MAVISWSYTGLIEHFPYSGGGYGVATKLLGPYFGLISGCALLVDYVLTITTSIASSVDQVFNVVSARRCRTGNCRWNWCWSGGLIVLNLRGIKESITIIVPIFLLFCLTHLALMAGIIILHPGAPGVGAHIMQMHREAHADAGNLGLWVVLVIFLQAYSRGAGTYTGIEAVSNGVSAMREPQVPNAKRTMLYMAVSLAVTAGGLMLCYLLADLHPVEGRTMNGLLVDRLSWGDWFTWLTLGTEAGLLLFAAQTGYIGGPRVMANMALDGWVPRRFSSLSDRLTSHYGVLMVGGAADREPALHARLGRRAGDDVRDQRVRDLLAVAARHDAVLVGAPQEARAERHVAGDPHAFLRALLRHAGRGGDPEVRGGRVGDAVRHRRAHHRCAC